MHPKAQFQASRDSLILPQTARLLELTARMKSGDVAVYADLVADRFIGGTPSRVSREAPVVILERESDRVVAGGGANAAANVAQLGGRAHLFGVVGEDRSGQLLLEDLRRARVDTQGVLCLAQHDTPTKTRILGGFGPNKQQIVRIDSGAGSPPDDERDRQLLEALKAYVSSCQERGTTAVLMISDYGYGCIEPQVVRDLRERNRDLRVLVDSRHRLASFPGATVATPNLEEAEALAGTRLQAADDLVHQGRLLRQRLGVEVLLVTRGSRGMALFLEDRHLLIPVYGTDEVRDVTGAGDTVIGTFALATAAGANPSEAAVLANFAGGIVVLKAGTATVRPSELETAIGSAQNFLEELAWAAY